MLASDLTHPTRERHAVRPAAHTRQPEQGLLVVGQGVIVRGILRDVQRLVVEGTVEATLATKELAISSSGRLEGNIETAHAEIAGEFSGRLMVLQSLVVMPTGRLHGQVFCRRLRVADGGAITGRLEMVPAEGAMPETIRAGGPSGGGQDHYRQMEESLQALVKALPAGWTEADRAEVQHFIDVGEYGLALETLAGIAVEEDRPFDKAFLDRVAKPAEIMQMLDSPAIRDLRRHLKVAA